MLNHHNPDEARHDEAWQQVGMNWKAVEEIGEQQGLWYESPEDIVEKLERGQARAVLMRWVLRQMLRRLDARERRCVELHYLECKSFRDVAAEVGVTRTASVRIVRGAIQKLRRAAAMSRHGSRQGGASG